MPKKRIATTNKPQAVIEPEETKAVAEEAVAGARPDIAVLDGDYIKVVRDYSHLSQLSTSPALLLDKDNRDVKVSMPEWHFAWFTERDADRFSLIGFMPVHRVFRPGEVRAPIQTAEKLAADGGVVKYLNGDATEYAYCIERDNYDAYNAAVQEANVISTEQLEGQAAEVFRSGEHEFADAVIDTPGEGIGEREIHG